MKDRGFALSMNLERGKLREERERESRRKLMVKGEEKEKG